MLSPSTNGMTMIVSCLLLLPSKGTLGERVCSGPFVSSLPAQGKITMPAVVHLFKLVNWSALILISRDRKVVGNHFPRDCRGRLRRRQPPWEMPLSADLAAVTEHTSTRVSALSSAPACSALTSKMEVCMGACTQATFEAHACAKRGMAAGWKLAASPGRALEGVHVYSHFA